MTENSVSFHDIKAALLARGCVSFLIFFAFFCGCFVAGAALHDPDTCWLLALGKQIIENQAVPFKDTFSYTFQYLASDGAINYNALLSGAAPSEGGRIFVAYQWLSEVVFYLSYMVAAGYGVVGTACIALVSSLIIVPLVLFQRLKSSMLVGILLVVFGVVASCFHFLARPEVFSYFFWSLTLLVLCLYRYRFEVSQSVSKVIFLIPLMLLAWANMHTGFAYAFIALVYFCFSQLIECGLEKRKPGKYEGFAFGALALSFLASLLNPHGIKLWTYMPELFFSPLNKFIEELRPLSVNDLTEWTYYPFFIVSAAVLAILIRNVVTWIKKKKLPKSWLFSVMAILTAIGGGIVARRVIPFDTIFLVMEAAWLLRHTGVPIWDEGEHHDEHDTLLHTADHKLGSLMKEGAWAVMVIVFSLLGVFLISTRVVPPTIPQESSAFPAPQRLINFIAKQDDLGRVFNDPQIGDMIIWYLQTDPKAAMATDPWRPEAVKYRPKVFIDTRFDMYAEPLVSDYHQIANCKPGWKALFERYNFDWVVLRKKQNLAKKLMEDDNWKVIYKDSGAVLFVRSDKSQENTEQPLEDKE